MKIKFMLGTLTAALLIVGCSNTAAPAEKAAVQPTITEESLGLRKTDLYTEKTTVPDQTNYAKTAAGSGQTIERAYDNAPPMIPHDTEGMLPITKKDNACLGCHMPEVAPSMGATSIPKSHFTSFRPTTSIADDGKITKEGKEVDNTSDFKTITKGLDHMYQGRYNCSQCHAPQSTDPILVKNTFRPDFQSDEMKKGSSLLDTINAGVE